MENLKGKNVRVSNFLTYDPSGMKGKKAKVISIDVENQEAELLFENGVTGVYGVDTFEVI